MRTLFPREQIPYFIMAPPWTHKSSGVMTLHLLCHALNSVGQKAYIALQSHAEVNVNPRLLTPPLTIETMNHYKDNFIAVYPDVVRGNPMNAKNVVRYLLAPAGKYGGDKVFSEGDLIYGSLPTIADKVLRLPVCDTSVFYRGCEERSGACFYAHKYDRIHNQTLLPITDGMTRLEGYPEDIAAILRKSEVCYLYEPTSVITEAALCGCPVVLIRTPYFNTIDLACMMGNVKWNDGEIVNECNDYLPEYQEIVGNFWDNLNGFIKETQGRVTNDI